MATGHNESPSEASKPWDVDRSGFVMSEGAAVVVLEDLKQALDRGAQVMRLFYREILVLHQFTSQNHVSGFGKFYFPLLCTC